jgi:hypothetical protein
MLHYSAYNIMEYILESKNLGCLLVLLLAQVTEKIGLRK